MIRIGLCLIFMLALTACSAGRETPTVNTEAPTRTRVPTYTPTPLPPEPPTTSTEPEPTPAQAALEAPPAAAPILLPTATPVATPVVLTAANEPVLTVAQDAVAVRSGPGTDYPLVGLAVRTATYPITGRNAAGDWWQICCIDGQPGWLFGDLVTVANADTVAIAELPAAPTTPAPPGVVEALSAPTAPAAVALVELEPLPATSAVVDPPQDSGGTAGNFDPNAQYQIVHYRVLGFDDNNGGIFNKGGQQLIFLTVLDQNGNPVDGAVVKDAVGDKLNVVTGSKGPGKAEIKMDWDPYKLYVASEPGGPVTSQISNQLNNPNPHLPDVIGKLGPLDNEYAVCPTPEVNCTPPFFTIHFSYEITFQRVK
jgi:hypothetical protein